MVEQLRYYHLQLLQELCPKCCLWYPLGLAFPSTLQFPYKHMGHAGGTYTEGTPNMHSSRFTVSDKPSCLPQDASSMALVYQSDCIILLSQITNFPNVCIQANSLYRHVLTTLFCKTHIIPDSQRTRHWVSLTLGQANLIPSLPFRLHAFWAHHYCPLYPAVYCIYQHHCTLASRG